METNGIGYMDYLGYAGYLNVTCYIGYFGYQQSLNERISYLNYSLSNILKTLMISLMTDYYRYCTFQSILK